MKIAVHIPKLNKTEGGSFFYIKILIDFFSKYKGEHEFIFFNTDSSILSFNKSSEEKKYYYFDTDKAESKLNNELKSRGWKRTLWFFDVIEYRLKIKLFSFLKYQLQSAIYTLREEFITGEFMEFITLNKIDCVYYTHPLYCYNPDVPFICTVWDLGHLTQNIFPEISGNGQYAKRHDYYNKILPRAFKIIRESEYGKMELKQYYNIADDKIVVFPQFPGEIVNMAINDEEIKNILDSFELTGEKFIFYPAQFWPHKNHYNLLLASNYLKTVGVSVKLVLVGSDKGNIDYIKEVIKSLNLEKDVKLLGFIEDKELFALYKTALAMIYPSFLGPTNMPVVESLALGCPLLCSNLEGHIEQAGNAAIFFDPKDYKDIANAIIKICNDDSLRKQLIINGYEQFEKKSNLNINIKYIITAFDELECIRKCWK